MLMLTTHAIARTAPQRCAYCHESLGRGGAI
jgi:hypothetical protein